MKKTKVILLYAITFFILTWLAFVSKLGLNFGDFILALLIGLVGIIIGFLMNFLVNQLTKKPYNFNINELDILVFIIVWGILEVLGMGDLWTLSLGFIASYLFNKIRMK